MSKVSAEAVIGTVRRIVDAGRFEEFASFCRERKITLTLKDEDHAEIRKFLRPGPMEVAVPDLEEARPTLAEGPQSYIPCEPYPPRG